MSIIHTAGKFALKQASKEMVTFIKTGKVGPFGSMLRDMSTGKAVGYIQETRAMAALVALANPATAPIGAAYLGATAVQKTFDTNRTAHRIEDAVAALGDSSNRVEASLGRVEGGIARIEDKLEPMSGGIDHLRGGVEVLNDLGIANLALGAAGIGVSMAGFAMVSAKIDGVRRAIDDVATLIHAVSAQIEEVRRDIIEADFSALKTIAEQMDEAWLLTDGSRAERQWHDVAREAHRLQNRFAGRAEYLLAGPDGYAPADPMLDAFALASGLRFSALAACNETAASSEAARDASRTLQNLTGRIGLADLARQQVEAKAVEPGSQAWSLELTTASERARPVARKLRDREAALATRPAPLLAIEAQGISPRDWLRSAQEETEAPVLFMPAQDD